MMSLAIPPKVSVCIPNFNCGKYLSDAIRSVLSQTFTDFELVVVDNCSFDNSVEIINTYALADNRIRFFCNEKNVGMANNWNLCLEFARGEYIKMLCADDVLMPSCLEKLVKALENHPQAVLASCSRLVSNNSLERLSLLSYADVGMVERGVNVIKKCLLGGNLIGEPTAVIFKKSLGSRGFNPKYKHLIDLEMWLYLLENGDYVFIDEELCIFRQHENQGTRSNFLSFDFVDDEISILEKYKNRLSFLEKQKVNSKMAMLIWSGNNLESVFREIRKIYGLPFFILLLFVRSVRNYLCKIINWNF